jgi:hypothetical protein
MSTLSAIRTFLNFLFRRRRAEREIEGELRSHLRRRADDLESQGLSHEEAERQASVEFGGYERYKEECREALGTRLPGELLVDLRYGLRQLHRNPGFAVVAVITLALGIGANTAIFSLLDAVMLRPLPVRDPSQLVMLRWSAHHFPQNKSYFSFGDCAYSFTGTSGCNFPLPVFKEIQSQTKFFSGIAGFAGSLDPRIELVPAQQGLTGMRNLFAKPLHILMIAVALILLIACANVAGLLLARSRPRHKEMAVRLAVGAGRARIVRQVLTESVLLAALGGSVGVAFSYWGVQVLSQLMWGHSPAPISFVVAPDWRILAFAISMMLLTGILFGLAAAQLAKLPLWYACRFGLPTGVVAAVRKNPRPTQKRLPMATTTQTASSAEKRAIGSRSCAGIGDYFGEHELRSSSMPSFGFTWSDRSPIMSRLA